MFARCAVLVRHWRSPTPSNGHSGYHMRKCFLLFTATAVWWGKNEILTLFALLFNFIYFHFLKLKTACFLFGFSSSGLPRTVVTLPFYLLSLVVCVESPWALWHSYKITDYWLHMLPIAPSAYYLVLKTRIFNSSQNLLCCCDLQSLKNLLW